MFFSLIIRTSAVPLQSMHARYRAESGYLQLSLRAPSYKTTSSSGLHFLAPQQFDRWRGVDGRSGCWENRRTDTHTEANYAMMLCCTLWKRLRSHHLNPTLSLPVCPQWAPPSPPPLPTAHTNALIVPLPLALALFKPLQSLSLTDVSYGMLLKSNQRGRPPIS